MRRATAIAIATALTTALGLGGCADATPDMRTDALAIAPDDPGPVAETIVRRLNRAEYDNTVRDLLGTHRRPARDFPADERGHGFDTIAALQSVSPELMALYERAAESLAYEAVTDPQIRARVIACAPQSRDEEDACAVAVIDRMAPRAWRRPLSSSERDMLRDLYAESRDAGDDFDTAVAAVLHATLASPYFVFRIERDPAPGDPHPHLVDDYELATRLSYFLWSSMPDDALFSAAASGALRDPDAIEAHVHRMLDDERSRALVDDFAGQWLYVRALDDVFKDVTRYPAFDDELRASMRDELERFVGSFFTDDRDIRELLTADATEVDQRLAKLYGVATTPFDGLRTLDLSRLPRRGITTMPGLMTVLARPFRTAPVKRGAWVLSQLLCAPPPPPPAGVEGLSSDENATTMREQLAEHRRDPACAGCHAVMDPIGLAYEPYDGIGAWRSRDGGEPIDPSGKLPDGRAFGDAVELAELLADDPAFVDCVARQTMTYALGRGLVDEDEVHVQTIVDELSERGYGMRELLVLVARSVPFRWRRPQEDA